MTTQGQGKRARRPVKQAEAETEAVEAPTEVVPEARGSVMVAPEALVKGAGAQKASPLKQGGYRMPWLHVSKDGHARTNWMTKKQAEDAKRVFGGTVERA